MLDLLKFFRVEWAAIKAAIIPIFVIAVSSVVGTAWIVAEIYNVDISIKNDTVQHYEAINRQLAGDNTSLKSEISDLNGTLGSLRQQTDHLHAQLIRVAEQRRLTAEQRLAIRTAFHQVASELPPFTVASVANPEAEQSAHEFISAFSSAGLALRNGPCNDPVEVVPDTPDEHGIFLVVRDASRLPPSALIFAGTLRKIELNVQYTNAYYKSSNQAFADDLAFVVGPH